MFTKYGKPVLVLCVASLFSLSAQAHRSWLLPSSTQVDGKEPWVVIDAAVSENLFDVDTNAIPLTGLSVTAPNGSYVQPQNAFTTKLRSSFEIQLTEIGTYNISIVNESAMANYKLNGEVKRWRGAVDAIAKEVPTNAEELKVTRMHNRLETYVTNGSPEKFSFKATGIGLELMPLNHPNDFGIGKKASFRVLLDGKPIADQKLSIVPGGVKYRGILKEVLAVTDAKGDFAVVWPEAGMYWINASYPPRAPQAMEASNAGTTAKPTANNPPERRLSYSGTFEVLP